MATCPACHAYVMPGMLRCRTCGSDTRNAPAGVRMSFSLDSMLSEDQLSAIELVEELQSLAPAVAAWIRLDPETRGPRPDVHPARRARVEEVLGEMRLIRERLRPGPGGG